MRLFIQNDNGELVATYMDGKLLANGMVDTQLLAFELFVLLNRLINAPTGGIGISDPMTRPGDFTGDSDFGTAADPNA